MLLRHWSGAPPADVDLVAQSRSPGGGRFAWDPLDPDLPLRADVIFGFAGVVPRVGAETGLNVDLGRAAAEMARRCGARRLLLASSSAVYGARAMAREDDPAAPANPYGAAKLAMEAAVADAGSERGSGGGSGGEPGPEICCLRIGNVAWADALLGRMQPGVPVALDRFADGGGPVRSYIGPRSMARTLEALARNPGPLPPVLNLAAPAPVTMEALLRASGAPWEWVPAPSSAVQEVTLDCGRLSALVPMPQGIGAPEVLIAEGDGVRDAA